MYEPMEKPSVFDFLDYYTYAKSLNIDVQFIVIGNKINNKLRYDIDNIEYINNVIDLRHYTCKNLMSNIPSLNRTNNFIKYETLILFHTYSSFNTKLNKTFTNILHFNECPIIGKETYKKKIRFDLLPQIDYPENKIYCNLKGIKFRNPIDLNDELPNNEWLINIDKRKIIPSYKLNNYTFMHGAIDNFWSKWDKLYYTLRNTFENSPRLLLESRYMNKDIIYDKINNGLNDGMKQRKNTPLENHMFSEDDDIIKLFKNEHINISKYKEL